MNTKTLKTIKQNFVKELKVANAGKKTSLPFIVHKLSSASIVGDGEVFQVVVIGGTVGKVAIVKKTSNDIQILEKKDEKRLEFREAEDFLSFINKELEDGTNTLALNFAYPIKPVFENGRLDGFLLAVTKEGSFHGLVGKLIGKEIENYIFAKRNKKIKVAAANDTVCLLTSGLSKYKKESLAAAIVGTGFNISFFLDKERLVNLESANFDKFDQSKEGKLIDKESAKPGRSLFEKETAGAYLYRHFNLIIKKRNIKYSQISSTEELDKISHKKIPQVSEIAQDLIRRSAQLVACQIAGITEFKEHDLVFNMEGSLFWKGNRYKETVQETVKQLVPKHRIKFVEIEDSAILGAAKLVA